MLGKRVVVEKKFKLFVTFTIISHKNVCLDGWGS